MAETVKKGDFIELEYTGRTKEPEIVFDSTNEGVAKKEGFYSDKMSYGPVIICVGYNQILKGLDDSLEEVEIGKEIEVKLPAERAFGKKSTGNMKLVPVGAFKKNQIQPQVGLQVHVEGAIGIIKSISGGRVIVDFNHPLAGKDVVYTVKVIRKVDDLVEKMKSFIGMSLNLDAEKVEITLQDGKPTISMPSKIPQELLDQVGTKMIEAIPELKTMEWNA